MDKKQTYAVVDIETTGTNPMTDRMIQFGCVLISNGQIVSSFATDINPNQAISKKIQQLTGISNARVQKAPYFEDVAPTIYNLLLDTVFVAHNIYFDYTFLKEELMRCGMPELKLLGIDTVELAQIFLPTEKSFRLSDLSESLGLIHENPHQADSDAKVTAELLLILENKIRALPLVTMKKIVSLSNLTGMDTQAYLALIYEQMKKKHQPLNADIEIISGLALQRKDYPIKTEKIYEKKAYPVSKKSKEQLFDGKISYRSEQSRMMNLIYRHFTQGSEKNLFIEATTGLGKTLAYLFPISFLATQEQPVIISTVSILLQNQLLQKDVALVNRLLPQPLSATVVKSHRHYIDLQRFFETLRRPNHQKQYQLYQMRVLVWLTQTITGDLEELQLINYEHAFWQDIVHGGLHTLSLEGAFYQADFVVYLYNKMRQSNVLIVNHAFLVQENKREIPILPESHYLIIDEAQHLPEIAQKIASRQFNLLSFQKKIKMFFSEHQLFSQIHKLLKDEHESKRLLRIYKSALLNVLDELSETLYLASDVLKESDQWTLHVTNEIVDDWFVREKIVIQKLNTLWLELMDIHQQLNQIMKNNQTKYLISEQLVFDDARLFFQEIETIYHFFYEYMHQWEINFVKEIKIVHSKKETILLSMNDLSGSIITETSWYQRYQKIVYTGASLTFDKNKRYLADQLGVEEGQYKILADPYDYEKQARMYIPKVKEPIAYLNKPVFVDYLVDMIKTITQIEEQSILILFTSHDILKSVYHRVSSFLQEQNRELLAQGVNGSKEKLVKRFSQLSNSILLGTDSFWEGIDFPGEKLSIVIVTKLPFANPLDPMVKARYDYFEKQGISSFSADALPKAAIKMSQAFGRLIRSNTDKGVFIVLDRRLVTAKYGKKIQQTLPDNLPFQELPIEKIVKETQAFLKSE